MICPSTWEHHKCKRCKDQKDVGDPSVTMLPTSPVKCLLCPTEKGLPINCTRQKDQLQHHISLAPHTKQIQPLFFLYYHLVGIFPQCYPLEWDAVWGRQRSWHIEHHQWFGRGPEQCPSRQSGLTSIVWEAGYKLPHHPLNLAEYLGSVYAVACSDNLYINLRKFWQLKSISEIGRAHV